MAFASVIIYLSVTGLPKEKNNAVPNKPPRRMKFPCIKYLLPKGTVTLCLDHKVVCVYLKVTTVLGFIYVRES